MESRNISRESSPDRKESPTNPEEKPMPDEPLIGETDPNNTSQEKVTFPTVDPNGLQATGTGAAAAGLVLATSGASGVSQAGITAGVTHLLAAALAGTGTGPGVPGALTLGLALVALGVVLNFVSLALRFKEKEKNKGRRSAPAA
jgi:hypothetical protein